MKRLACLLISHRWGHWHYEVVTKLNITTGYNSCNRCGRKLVHVFKHAKL